jgi:hypothetical protein
MNHSNSYIIHMVRNVTLCLDYKMLNPSKTPPFFNEGVFWNIK